MQPPRLLLAAVVVLAAAVGAVGLAAPPAAAQASCAFPYSHEDSTGTEVTVERRPERVVVLGASAAQTIWEIGGRERVVGMPVQSYTAYLEGADERAPVMNEGGFTVNAEAVVDLEPDLVLAPNVIPVDTVEQLRDAGLVVYRFPAATDLDDVVEKTRLIGRLTGECDGAEATVAWMASRLAAVREAVADEPRPRVVYPLGGGFVAGEGTFIDAILTAAGAENIAARANVTGYRQVSPEVIIAQNPAWIVMPSDLPESAVLDRAYNTTTAVERDQIVRVDANLANQPAPRVVVPVETVARALHPEAFAATEASPTPTPVPATATPVESPGQPGFGLAVALGAVVAALLLRRRP